MAEYTKEQFWKLYEQLPKELKEAVFSEEVADHIFEACSKNGAEAKVSEIAKYTGRVLLGVLMPEDFQKTLEKEVGIAKETSQAIAREINRFVFFPVKESLMQIHTIIPSKADQTPSVPAPAAQTTASQPETPRRGRPKKADAYKEQIDEE